MTSNAMRTINAGKNAVNKVKDDPQALRNIQNPSARQQTRLRFLENQSQPRPAPQAPASRPKSLEELRAVENPNARQQGRMNFLQRQQPQGGGSPRPTSPMAEALSGNYNDWKSSKGWGAASGGGMPLDPAFNINSRGQSGFAPQGDAMWQGGSPSFNESASRIPRAPFSPTNGGMFTNPQASNPYLPSNPNIIPDGYGGAAGGGFRPGPMSTPPWYPKGNY